MAAGFIRRFTFDPGDEVLTEIEGVVIIDRDPPAAMSGVGSGTVGLVAEFEDGPFDEPTEIGSGPDLLQTFGGFGFTYEGTVSNYPCAQKRQADEALVPEYWNGNGYVALNGKRFRKLVVVRADTSVGSVDLRRLAAIKGGAGFTFNLEPNEQIVFNAGDSDATATFEGEAPYIKGGAGTYPTNFVGGETMTLAVDGKTYVVTFEVGDQTQSQVMARVNAMLGYAGFIDGGGGAITFLGRKRGTGGSVQVVSIQAAVATALGLAAGAAVFGSGNVADIDAVTAAEVNSVVSAAATAAGFSAEVRQDDSQFLWLINTGAPGTGTLEITSTSAANLGFAVSSADAAEGIDGKIPAGFRLEASGSSQVFVTMQSVQISATNGGPYRVKVRHAVDDGTGLAEVAGAIDTATYPVPGGLGFWAVSNPLPVSAALNEAQIDAAYERAIASTIDLSSIASQINIIISARQSNAIRTALRVNAVEASAQGCYGRITVIRPPLGTTRSAAKSRAAAPGVGAYRHSRAIYAFPGCRASVAAIKSKGMQGNGFTLNGVVDVGSDTWLASLMSQLPPEENPGQETDFMLNVLGLESAPDVQGMGIDDYKAFKSAGICAPRMADGKAIFQSGVTSVDPLAQPSLKNIARQRMADFIGDSLANRGQSYVKKLSTIERRAAMLGEFDAFLKDLKDGNRIADYSIDGKSGNTRTGLAKGIYRLIVKVQTHPSMDAVVIDVTVGESVDVQQAA